jgi:RNA polymerase sigma factor for flagellar operon FliA
MSIGRTPQTQEPDSSQGTEEQRQHLLAEHLPLVHYIAVRIHSRLPRHVPLEDLVNAGVLGLLDAWHKFDTRRDVQFGSYAKYRIRGAILDSLRELDWSPRDLRRQSRRVEEANSKLQATLGRFPTEDELSRELRMTIPELQKLLGEIDALGIHSFPSVVSDSGEELVQSNSDRDPFNQCLRSETRELLVQAIAELPEKEREVVVMYYSQELTMKKIGAMLGVGESRVSQIHSVAIMRLRTRINELMAARVELKQKGRAAGAG